MAKRRPPKGFSGDRWLVLVSDNWIADVKTYRRAYSLLSPSHDISMILMVSVSGRIEVLAGN
jgi:hypothetical protein